MADTPPDASTPTVPDLQHWTWVMGRAQQMMMEQGLAAMQVKPEGIPAIPGFTDPATLERARDFWAESLTLWQRFLDPAKAPEPAPVTDKRFKAPQWREPVFDLIRQSYELIGDHMLRGVEASGGVSAMASSAFSGA